jgi:hypothetical protein
MAIPKIVPAGQWQQARDELLKAEKEATRALDALAARRRRLPMVKSGWSSSTASSTCAPMAGRKIGRTPRPAGRSTPPTDNACPVTADSGTGAKYCSSLPVPTALGRQEDREEPESRALQLHSRGPALND